MLGSSTAADSPFASSIHPKRQAKWCNLISWSLYDNAAQLIFPITLYTLWLQFSFGLAIFQKLIKTSYCDPSTPPPPAPLPLFYLGRVKTRIKFSKRETSLGFQFLDGVATKKGFTFFRVVAAFTKVWNIFWQKSL